MQANDAFNIGTGQVHGYYAPWGRRATAEARPEAIPAGSYAILEQEGDVFRIAPIHEQTKGLALNSIDEHSSYYVKAEQLNRVGVEFRLDGHHF